MVFIAKPPKRGPKPRKPIPRKSFRINTGIDTSSLPYAKPQKKDRIGVKRRKAEIKEDSRVQRIVAGYGECQNCRLPKELGGNHRRKRRYKATRHLLSNLDKLCWPCNIAIESERLELLIKKYPQSIYIPEWTARLSLKTLRPLRESGSEED